MSILKFLGLERPDSQLEDTGTDTETVQRILAELDCLEPDRARYLAAFAYVLGRIAHADQHINDKELDLMTHMVQELGHLSKTQALLVVEISKNQNELFGATEDFLVTRQFREIATDVQCRELLDCVFAISAADDSISAIEESRIRQIASELGVAHDAYVSARAAYTEKRDVIRSFRNSAQSD